MPAVPLVPGLFFYMKDMKLFLIGLLGLMVFSTGCAHRRVRAVNMESLTPEPVEEVSPVVKAGYDSQAALRAVRETYVADVPAGGAGYSAGSGVGYATGSGVGGRLAPAVERVLYFGDSQDGAVKYGPTREYVRLREPEYRGAPVILEDPSLEVSHLGTQVDANVNALGSGLALTDVEPEEKKSPFVFVLGESLESQSNFLGASVPEVPFAHRVFKMKNYPPPSELDDLSLEELEIRVLGYSPRSASVVGSLPKSSPKSSSKSLPKSSPRLFSKPSFDSVSESIPILPSSSSKVSPIRDPFTQVDWSGKNHEMGMVFQMEPRSQAVSRSSLSFEFPEGSPGFGEQVVHGIPLVRVLSGSTADIAGMFFPLGISDRSLRGLYRAQDLISVSGVDYPGACFRYEDEHGGWGYFVPDRN
jgi:hypothetical protein